MDCFIDNDNNDDRPNERDRLMYIKKDCYYNDDDNN